MFSREEVFVNVQIVSLDTFFMYAVNVWNLFFYPTVNICTLHDSVLKFKFVAVDKSSQETDVPGESGCLFPAHQYEVRWYK